MDGEITGPALDVLLVEDNPGDVMLYKEALSEVEARCRIHVVGDGETALAFLLREDPHAGALTPDLVFLDLNLPKRNGFEVLEVLKQNPRLKHIPVLVISTSTAHQDILKSYEGHANCYIQKPCDYDGFIRTVDRIKQFWMTEVQLPLHPELDR